MKTDFLKNHTKYIFGLLVVLFIIIKIPFMTYSISDENTYFYMGKMVSEGKMPYKDFFFAHPPLQIYIYGLIFLIFGFNFLILKSISLIVTIATALFIYIYMKENYDETKGLVASAIFLFSYELLRASTYNMGINIAAMLVMAGFYFLSKKRLVFSGSLLGLATITRLYSLIPIAIIFIFVFLKNKDDVKELMKGFLPVVIIPNLIFWIVAGKEYITNIISYHLNKPGSDDKIALLYRILKDNLLISLTFLLGFLIKKKEELKTAFYISIGYLLFIILFQKVFGFYLISVFPFMVIVGTISLFIFSKKIVGEKKGIVFILIILLLSTGFSINKFSKNKFQNVDAEPIGEYIIQISQEQETIFGDDSLTPLLALLSKREIALDYADSNNLRFRSGIDDIDEVINSLKEEKNKIVVVYELKIGNRVGRYGPAYMDEFQDYVKEECNIKKTFSEEYGAYEKDFLIYTCKDENI